MKNTLTRIIDISLVGLAILAAASALAFLRGKHQQPEPQWQEGPTIRVCPPRRITVDAGTIVAVAYEADRKPDGRGFAKPIRGELVLNGRCYRFVSGGRGRGSIPFGVYRIGAAADRPYLNSNPGHTAYPMSDVYDTIAKDMRKGLFIHPAASATAGCIGIDAAQWEQFERDMREVRPQVLNLVAGGARNG